MGEGPENACRFEAPRRWKMFGASRTLPGAGRPSKLSSRGGGKGLSQGGDQEPDDHSVRVPLWREKNLPEGPTASAPIRPEFTRRHLKASRAPKTEFCDVMRQRLKHWGESQPSTPGPWQPAGNGSQQGHNLQRLPVGTPAPERSQP